METINNQMPDILKSYIQKMQIDRKSENTIKSYSLWLVGYIKYLKSIKYKCSKTKEIDDIDISTIKNSIFKSVTVNDIEKYEAYLTDVKGNNGNSINRKRASIKMFHKFLLKRNLVVRNVVNDVDKLNQSEKVREPLTLNEIELLLATIQSSQSRFKLRNMFLFLLLTDTGARETELTKLTLSQIHNSKDNENECYLILHGKGDHERLVYLSDMSIKVMSKYLIERDTFLKAHNFKSEFLFCSQVKGESLSSSLVLGMLKDYAEECGLDRNKICVHTLRHSSATIKHEHGVDIRTIQEILGHASITTTQRYVSVSKEKMKSVSNSLNIKLDI